MFRLFCFVYVVVIGTVSARFLAGSAAKCDNEGEEVKLPLVTRSSCIKCFCRNGEVNCEKDLCNATKGCHLILFHRPKGACCDVCKGCNYNGTFYASGTTWSDHVNPCQTFTCKAGVITSSTTQCYLPCKNPVLVPGQCCPACHECSVEGKTYTNGQVFSLKSDNCVSCRCKDGSVQCSKAACPVLNCPKHMVYTPEGACCPTCRGSRKVFSLRNHCLFRYKVYKSSQSLSVDKCTRCGCDRGTMTCHRQTCPVLSCPRVDIVYDPTSCCARCKVTATRSCDKGVVVHKHGNFWRKDKCTTCSCYDGQVTCESQQCPNTVLCPTNHRLTTVPGECCPRCVEADGVCNVFGDPHYRTFDGLFFTFQGQCKYMISKDCRGSNFSVGVRNRNRYRKPLAWTKSVDIQLRGHKITLMSKHKVKVQKKPVNLPYVEPEVFTVEKEGNLVVLTSSVGLKVSWNGDSFLEVSVRSSFKHRLCGMCGNYNGIKRDDFTGKDGTLQPNVESFGNSWRYGGKNSCRSNKPVTGSKQSSCKTSFSKWRRAHKMCSAMRSSLFSDCRKQVDFHLYYESCLTDVCNCPKKHACSCDAVAAFAHACKQTGHDVDWSKLTACPQI